MHEIDGIGRGFVLSVMGGKLFVVSNTNWQ